MQDGQLKKLREYILNYLSYGVIVANSGGVDSAFLLYMTCQLARQYGLQKVYAVTVKTRMNPAEDAELAKQLSENFDAVYKVIELDELEEISIADNPKNRCYLCKKVFFEKIIKLADSLGVKYIFEGTNADDLKQKRPGIKAISELGIISPLAVCGITKDNVRNFAGQFGLSVAKRPSSPCLATRIPYGDHITYELLNRIEQGERFLRSLGFYNVRLRVHGDVARIEVDSEYFEQILFQGEKIIKFLKKIGFVYITVDLEGFRSGSMDIPQYNNY